MLRIWRFATILLVSLSMGMAFCHALELIPKMRYDAPLYLTLQRTLYLLFGAPLGAAIELGAVAGSVVLAFLARRCGPRFSDSDRCRMHVGSTCNLVAVGESGERSDVCHDHPESAAGLAGLEGSVGIRASCPIRAGVHLLYSVAP
jgi:hypothetical protein